MARLSNAQLAKLSSEERRAREKRLAYGRAYDARRKALQAKTSFAHKRIAASKQVSKHDADALVSMTQRLITLAAQLGDIDRQRVKILDEFRELTKNAK
jgi:hypothetical protein